MTTVAIQGIVGSFSEEAALNMCGMNTQIVEFGNFRYAVDAVAAGRTNLAVLPIENRIVGIIEPVEELLRNGKLTIVRRFRLAIDHVLIGGTGTRLEDQKSVVSHPIALSQCSRFLMANSHLRAVVGSDTAASVRDVIGSSDEQRSAIGSRRAADIYGGEILQENISDQRENWTDFVALTLK